MTFSPTSRQYDWSAVTTPGTFTLKINAQIAGCTPVTSSFTVTITKVSAAFVVNQNSPPYFDPILSDITLEVGKTQVYKFPSIVDNDQGDSGSFASLNTGIASGFVTGIYPTLNIAPTMDPQHVGTFPISVTIKDTHSATATFNFQIIVQSSITASNNQSTAANATT